jgi:hypothetical protein
MEAWTGLIWLRIGTGDVLLFIHDSYSLIESFFVSYSLVQSIKSSKRSRPRYHSLRTARFNTMNLCILSTHCVYTFYTILTMNMNHFPIEHALAGPSRVRKMCSL